MFTDRETLISELTRLRTMTNTHKRISEETESELRRVRADIQAMAKELRDAHERLHRAYSSLSNPQIIDAIWDNLRSKVTKIQNI